MPTLYLSARFLAITSNTTYPSFANGCICGICLFVLRNHIILVCQWTKIKNHFTAVPLNCCCFAVQLSKKKGSKINRMGLLVASPGPPLTLALTLKWNKQMRFSGLPVICSTSDIQESSRTLSHNSFLHLTVSEMWLNQRTWGYGAFALQVIIFNIFIPKLLHFGPTWFSKPKARLHNYNIH